MSHVRNFDTQLAKCWRLVVTAVLFWICGCLSGPSANTPAGGTNAIQLPANSYNVTWERAVAVLNDLHFTIARESKQEGVIETQYRAGSNLAEPWHHDSIGYANRLESTLHSIRRRVFVTFQSVSPETVQVSVRVDKEIEDLPGLAANYEGGATFSESQPLERDLDQVLGQSGPSRWIFRGHDRVLEAEIMRQIRFATIR